ncbi:MAG: hypothetical protein AAF502_20500 [Bacteroidota bacterium]
MTRIIFLFLIILATSTISHAQTTNFVNGYVVTTEGDTLKGLLRKYRYSAKPSTVAIFQDKTGKKTKYKPKDLISYKVGTDKYETKIYSRPGLSPIVAFMKVVIEGHLTLYSQAYQSASMPIGPNPIPGGTDIQESYYLEKQGYPLFFVKKMKFRKEIASYISDSESTINRMNEEKMKYTDLRTIVNMYNNDMRKQND